MTASLTLLPRKEFELTLKDGAKVQGQFGVWSLKRFGEKKKLGLTKVMELFGEDASLGDMIDFVLCAVEYKDRQANRPVSMTDVSLCQWFDDYTEDTGEAGVLMMLFAHSGSENKEQKKSLDDQWNGPNSSDMQPAQE